MGVTEAASEPVAVLLRCLPACMGGWCQVRGSCARYHAEGREARLPVERLCGPGAHELYQPIVLHEQQAVERHTLAIIHGTAAS